MIDIPIDKALVPVETDEQNGCEGCERDCYGYDSEDIACRSSERKDGKNVIFKLADYPPEEKPK
jgi:hypothetical protein